jgi:hypothetical protein
MATFRVPVWFNVVATDATHALELINESLTSAILDTDEQSAMVLNEYAVEPDDVIEVTD